MPKHGNKEEIGFINFLNETDIALSSMFPEDDDRLEEEVHKKEVNVERVNSNVIIVSKASTVENNDNEMLISSNNFV